MKRSIHFIRHLFCLLIAFAMGTAVYADNGVVATAVPVSGIVVDGDLSDWPTSLVSYPISYPESGDVPESFEDLQAHFQIGYHEGDQRFYVAVTVRDESLVLNDTKGDWCRLFVRNALWVPGERPVFDFVQFDDRIRTVLAPLDRYRVTQAAQFGVGVRQYEFAIKGGDLKGGDVLGFDLWIKDLDADGSSSEILWGVGRHKTNSDGGYYRLGDVVLGGEATGQVIGQMKWAQTQAPVRRGRVMIQSASVDSGDVIVAETGVDGSFGLDLPVGAYWIAAFGDTLNRQMISVKSGEKTVLMLNRFPSKKGAGDIALRDQLSAKFGNRQGLWQSFSGLHNWGKSRISKIIQDYRGYIWVSSRESGVFRYDGQQLEKLDLPPSLNVLSLYEDSKHHLWASTRNQGVWCYDPDQGKLTQLSPKDGLVDHRVREVLEDRQGDLWFVTENGLSQYDGVQFENYNARDGLSPGAHLNALFEDPTGLFWVGGRYGLNRFHPDSLAQTGQAGVLFTSKDGLLSDNIDMITQDAKGNIWIGTDGGLNRYVSLDYKNTFVAYTEEEGVPHNSINALAQDIQGNLWIATRLGLYRSGSLFSVGLDSLKFVLVPNENLDNHAINALLADREGHLWVGSNDTGLHRYDAPFFFQISHQDGLADNDVQCMLEDRNGNLWFGTANGVTRYRVGTDADPLTTFRTEQGLVHNFVLDLVEDLQGRIWISTLQGVSRYDPILNEWKTFTTQDGLPDQTVYVMLADRHGYVWFGTWTKGLGKYDGQTFVVYGEKDGIAEGRVDALYEDPTGQVWVGGLWGISKIDDEGLKSVGFSRRGRVIYKSDGGSLWISDGEFIYRTENPNLDLDWNRLRSENRQAFRFRVEAMLEDDQGHMWFGTAQGVKRHNGTLLHSLVEGGNQIYPWVQDLLKDRQGNIWIATKNDGVVRYHPSPVVPFAMHLTNVIADRDYGSVDALTLTTDQRYVSFVFWTDRYVIQPDAILYRYRLKGFDDAWQHTYRNQVDFENLAQGDYVFEIEAVDRDFNVSTPLQVSLSIVPLWYETPYKLGIVGLLGFGFIGGSLFVTQRYVRQRRESARLRRQMYEQEHTARLELEAQNEQLAEAKDAADLANVAKSTFLANMSHEIRTPMNAILGYAQILNHDDALNPEHKKAIYTIGQSGEHLLGLINDILDISKIEAGHEQLTPIDFDLKVMLEGLSNMFDMRCRQKNLQWQLISDVIEGTVYGDQNKLRQILINLVGNAVKFTEKGSVTLSVHALENDHYRFEVADTGQGISKDKQAVIFEPFQQDVAGMKYGGTGLGLAISLRHVEMMGGKMTLTSEEDEGATFSFAVQLKQGRQDLQERDTTDWSCVLHLAEGQTISALVVDDVANNVDILAHLLTQIGVLVRTAHSGQKALELLRENVPDIVFSDIRMPNMNGAELLKYILDEHGTRAPKMIATTASVFEHQRQQYLDMGFDAFVNKPIQFEDVYACMAEQLGVTYVFKEKGETVSDSQTEIDLKNVALPAQLLSDLKKAVEDASITDLREHVQTLSEMENMHAFVMLVRERLQRYDFDGIREILDNLKSA